MKGGAGSDGDLAACMRAELLDQIPALFLVMREKGVNYAVLVSACSTGL